MAHTDECPIVHIIGDVDRDGRQCFALVHDERVVLIDPVTNIVQMLTERGLDLGSLDTVVVTDLTVRLRGLAEFTLAERDAVSMVGPGGVEAALSHEPGSPLAAQEGRAGGDIIALTDGEAWEKGDLSLTASQHGQSEPMGFRASLGGHTVAYASNPDQAARLTSTGNGVDLLLVNLSTDNTAERDQSSLAELLSGKDGLEVARIMGINADAQTAAAATEQGLECAQDGQQVEL